ncbi:MAG: PKD domain-containing protein, partial [Bacteroidota bacterium]
MKYLFSICTLFLLCTFSMVQAQISIYGVVFDSSNGLPLPNYSVRIDSEPGVPVATTTTDASGVFTYNVNLPSVLDLTLAWENCSNPGDTLSISYGAFIAGDTLDAYILCDTTIGANFPSCTADFFYSQAFGNNFTFFEQAGGNNLTYSWDFGDGTTATGPTPSHTYAAAGTYTVCLVIADSLGGCTDSLCQQVVAPFSPGTTCNAEFFIGAIYDDTVAFYSVSNPGPSGSLSYQWSFGDGGSSNAQDPVHFYPGPGSYTVCLVVENTSISCTDTFCQTVTIPNNCSINFSSSGNIDSVAFFASIPPTGNGSDLYVWDFGDGSDDTTTTDFISHFYNASGTYLVCLTYINSGSGCFTSYCDSVSVIVVSNCNLNFASTQLDTFTYQFSSLANITTNNPLLV